MTSQQNKSGPAGSGLGEAFKKYINKGYWNFPLRVGWFDLKKMTISMKDFS